MITMRELNIKFENASIDTLTFVREKFDYSLNNQIEKLKTMRVPCYDNVLRWDKLVAYALNGINPFYFIDGLECEGNIDRNPQYNAEGKMTHIELV